MSTPNEFPDPAQGGGGPSGPPPPGYGSQPNPQAPPPYQNPGYQQQTPGQQGSGANFKFELPKDMPSSLNDVLPAGGFSGIFKTGGLPQAMKISYILWLATAAMWLFFTFFSFLGSLFQLLSRNYRGEGFMGIVTAVVAVVLIAAIVVSAMKLKEGKQWARIALSAIVVAGILLTFVGGTGGGLLGIAAAILMWLPESTAWLNSRSKA